ncbi:FCF1 protein [Wuchereria bancrofti]|uniref:FCF1 protein n=1 Tax=Wuchereria bancrofti TaxID=6293 RepID=J9ELT7_WUCBA|nr:FCF1 protein [Wuchereria bancrofti]
MPIAFFVSTLLMGTILKTSRKGAHKCYMVATCDKDLKRRIRKIPGVPILYIRQHRFSIERMPDAYGAPVN